MKYKKHHLLQIDLLKGLAIISIILLHTVALPAYLLPTLYLGQAIPIFMVIMGINFGLSQEKSNMQTYLMYLQKRFTRFGIPFLCIYILLLLYRIWELKIGRVNTLIGKSIFPFTAPGDYFILLLFSYIISAPLLYHLYSLKRRLTLIASFFIAFLFELFAAKSSLLDAHPILYSGSLLIFLPAIFLGFWISQDFNIFSKRNLFILYLLPLSLIYLIINNSLSFRFPFFLDQWQTQIFITIFYTVILILLGIRYLPSHSNNKLTSFLKSVGIASYHIFLIQLLYFTLRSKLNIQIENMFLEVLISLSVCIGLGLLFSTFI